MQTIDHKDEDDIVQFEATYGCTAGGQTMLNLFKDWLVAAKEKAAHPCITWAKARIDHKSGQKAAHYCERLLERTAWRRRPRHPKRVLLGTGHNQSYRFAPEAGYGKEFESRVLTEDFAQCFVPFDIDKPGSKARSTKNHSVYSSRCSALGHAPELALHPTTRRRALH
jgi:hypothetical protein